MGLFSGKTLYAVNTTSHRVIEEDKLQDTTLKTVLNAVMGDRPIPRAVMDSFDETVGYRVERMAREAETSYPEGVMRSDLASNTGQRTLIKQAIQGELGQTVSLDYAVLAPINYPHLVWQTLTEDYGYDRTSNRLMGLAGNPYLETFRVLLPLDEFDRALATGGTQALGDSPHHGYTPDRLAQGPALREWVDNPPAVIGEARNDIRVEVAHVAKDGTTGVLAYGLAPEGDSDLEFYQAMYLAGGQPGYWTYRYGAGSHGDLDQAYELGPAAKGQYLPVIYFRLNHENLSDDSLAGTADYDAAAGLCEILGMDYAGLGDSIHENPDIADVRNAFLMFGASGNSDDPLVIRYLYAFFADLHAREGQLDPPPGPLTVLNRGGLKQAVTLNIRPSQDLGEHRLGARLRLTHGGSTKRIRAGKVGALGAATRTTSTTTETVRYLEKDYDPEKGLSTYEEATTTVTRKVLVLRYQASASTYHELRIVDPSLRHQIDGSGRVTHNGLGDPDFLIPVDRSLLVGWNQRDKEMLYQRAMHLVFNARQTIELEWYQTAFFKFVLVVVAVVITIYTGIPAYQAMAAAFAAGGITALAWAVLVAVVKMAAFQVGFKLVAEELGPEFALIAAVVAAVYGGFRAVQNGSLQNAPWAQELLQASTGLSKASAADYQGRIADYQGDMQAFDLMAEEAFAELEEVNNLLDSRSLLDPFGFIGEQPTFIPGEAPENFYRRTIHSGNIGTVAIDAVHHYVDLSLKLPDFSNTARDLTYG